MSSEDLSTSSFIEADGFLDVLKDVSRAVAPIAQTGLKYGSPLLGPLGAQISAIDGIALGALDKAVSVSDSCLLKADDADGITPERGISHRAILAEATLQSILRKELSAESEWLLRSMEEKYQKSGFTTSEAERLGKQIAPLLSQADQRLTADGRVGGEQGEWHATVSLESLRSEGEADVMTGDEQVDSMINAIRTAQVEELDTVYADSFFGDIGGFVRKALEVATPVLLDGARTGLETIENGLVTNLKARDADAVMTNNTSDVASDEKATALLVHRAVLAECALQAVVEADKEALQESVLLRGDDGVQVESFFGGLIKVVKEIGPVVLNIAPVVLKSAVPVLSNVGEEESVVILPQPVKMLEEKPVRRNSTARSILDVAGNEGGDRGWMVAM